MKFSKWKLSETTKITPDKITTISKKLQLINISGVDTIVVNTAQYYPYNFKITGGAASLVTSQVISYKNENIGIIYYNFDNVEEGGGKKISICKILGIQLLKELAKSIIDEYIQQFDNVIKYIATLHNNTIYFVHKNIIATPYQNTLDGALITQLEKNTKTGLSKLMSNAFNDITNIKKIKDEKIYLENTIYYYENKANLNNISSIVLNQKLPLVQSGTEVNDSNDVNDYKVDILTETDVATNKTTILTKILYRICTTRYDFPKYFTKYIKILQVTDGETNEAEPTEKEFVQNVKQLVETYVKTNNDHDIDAVLISKDISYDNKIDYRNTKDEFIKALINETIGGKKFQDIPKEPKTSNQPSDNWLYIPIKNVRDDYLTNYRPTDPINDNITGTFIQFMQLLQKLLKIKPQKDDSHDTEEAFHHLYNLVLDLKNLPQDILKSEKTTDEEKITDFGSLIKIVKYLKQLADPNTEPDTTVTIDENETIKSIQLLQKLIEQLRTSDITPKESINRLDQFRSKTKAFLKSLFSGEKLFGKLDEIERNITDTLEIFGSPFLERGQKEVEILRLNPDPKEARLLYQGFEENIHKLRKELNASKDDNKKFLAKLLDYVSLIQDLKEETRYRLMNELNLQIKSDGIPMQFNFGSYGRENKDMPILKVPGTGGGKENDENIEMYGGAEEKTKDKETDKEKAQKVLEQIQEIRLKLNKINNFIEKEIKPKYDGYKSNTFKKIFDYDNDPNITKDEQITKSIDDDAIRTAKQKKDNLVTEISQL